MRNDNFAKKSFQTKDYYDKLKQEVWNKEYQDEINEKIEHQQYEVRQNLIKKEIKSST